jgi:hypothetical protein
MSDMSSQESSCLSLPQVAEQIELIRKAIRPMDCGWHHCRYCPAGSSNGWRHDEHCCYQQSVKDAETAAEACGRILSALESVEAPLRERIRELENYLELAHVNFYAEQERRVKAEKENACLLGNTGPKSSGEGAPVEAWEPIETFDSEYDGVPMLVKDGYSRIVVAWRGQQDPKWWSVPGSYSVKPTHWMPLPELPRRNDEAQSRG